MRLAFSPLLLSVALSFSIIARAGGEEFRPAPGGTPAAAIGSLIDAQTVAVAHADLQRLPIAELLKSVAAFLPEDENLRELQPRVAEFSKQFAAAGGRDLYLVASLADLPDRSPYWLAPLAKEADAEKLSGALQPLGEVRERLGGVLFAGSRETLTRLKQSRGAARPELAKAFDAVEGSAAQLLVLPTADARRVVEELQPTLPAVAGGGPSTLATRGALWLAIGIEAARGHSARLIIQSQDHAAATALRSHWEGWYRLLAQMAGDEFAPRLIRFVNHLTPQVKGDRLALELNAEQLEQVRFLLKPVMNRLEERRRFVLSTNNLKQIGLAMHVYADTHKHFPAAAIYDDAGRPLLSWRVAVLPQLGHEALYREFHLDEPWDSEHNARLIERMPAFYRSPGQAKLPAGRTSYVVPVGDHAIFHGREGTRFQEITDGTSNTLLAVETDNAHAVIWTKPDDWSVADDEAASELASPYGNRILVLLCDGAVLTLKWPLKPEVLGRLVSRNGGEPLDISELMWRGE